MLALHNVMGFSCTLTGTTLRSTLAGTGYRTASSTELEDTYLSAKNERQSYSSSLSLLSGLSVI